MSTFYYVYVPKDSRRNFETGKAREVWGWRSSALDRSSKSDRRSNREVAQSMKTGDYVILGHDGSGGPRVTSAEFATATLAEVVFARVKRPLYTSTTSIWCDELYPERIDLGILNNEQGVAGVRMGASAMEALRRSGTLNGVPVAGEAIAVTAIAQREENHVEDLDPADLGFDGELDVLAIVARRKEQKKLRIRKFGPQKMISCDLCGRTLPRHIVAAAHIKRRADATRAERLNLANIMAACLLGCDALFEHGYVYVDSAGFVRAADTEQEGIADARTGIEGRRCSAFNEHSRDFFAWHANRAEVTVATTLKRTDGVWPTTEWTTGSSQAGHRDSPVSTPVRRTVGK